MVWNSWNVFSSIFYLTKFESLIIIILKIKPFSHTHTHTHTHVYVVKC